MRRRLVYLVGTVLWSPVELLAEVGYVPPLWFLRGYVALHQTVDFVLDALLWINRDTGCRGRRP
jgi:hypothetical protein